MDNAYKAMIDNLNSASENTLVEISNAYAAEERINTRRNDLRDEEIESIENERKNYQTSVYYMDVVRSMYHRICINARLKFRNLAII